MSFAVHLDNFAGPFDLLLSLIAKHELDITEVALAQVTDEFVVSVSAADRSLDLEATTEFLVVAATLLDLKAARLLPQAEVEDGDDLATLEARDLLFAKLLQYRAFKQFAGLIDTLMSGQGRSYPASVPLEEGFAALRPPLTLGIDATGLAELAAVALAPKAIPTVGLTHLHAPAVSVTEQATLLVDRLRQAGSASFRTLSADAPTTLTTVARFLALLDLFRRGHVAFEQVAALGDLTVRWIGSSAGAVTVTDEFDVLDEFDMQGVS